MPLTLLSPCRLWPAVISSKLNLSERTAGVTLLALGNGAPDLFSVLNLVDSGKRPTIFL